MLNLELHKSQRLALWLVLAHAVAAFSSLIVAIPLWLKIIVLLTVGLSLAYGLTHHAWRLWPHSIVGLQADREGGLGVRTRGGHEFAAQVLPASSVAAFLTIIVFKPLDGGRTQAVLILPDSLLLELFRQLRVWLKWQVVNLPAAEPQALTLSQS